MTQSKTHKRDLLFWIAIPLLMLVAVFRFASYKNVVLDEDSIRRRDFTQDIAMACAIDRGMNPYLPISNISADCLQSDLMDNFPHASPHLPLIPALLSPLSKFFTTREITSIWFDCSLLFLVLGSSVFSYIFFRDFKPIPVLTLLLGALSFSNAVKMDLILGSFSAITLVLIASLVYFLEKKSDVLVGASLALLLLVKLVAWPLVIYFFMRKRWTVVKSLLLTLTFCGLYFSTFLNIESVRSYLSASSEVAKYYRLHSYNFSVWTMGAKLFEGVQYADPDQVSLSELQKPESTVSVILSGILFLGVLYRSLKVALRIGQLEGVLLLVAVSTILNPVAWTQYLVILIANLLLVLRTLSMERDNKNLLVILALIYSILVFVPNYFFIDSLRFMSLLVPILIVLSTEVIARYYRTEA